MRLKGLEKSLKGQLFKVLSPLKGKELKAEQIDLLRVRRVLVVRGDERLGNLLMLTPFLKVLKSSLPQAEIWALVSRSFSSVLKGNPNIDRILTLNKKGFLYNPFTLVKFLVGLMGGRFDLSFDCSHQDSLSFNNGLFTFLSLAPYRVGFRRGRSNPFLNIEIPPPKGKAHQIETNLSLLGFLRKEVCYNGMEVFLAPREREKAKDVLRNLGIDSSSFFVGIHIGGRRDKRWDMGKFVSLARRTREDYGFPVLIFWGPGEEGILRSNRQLFSREGILLPQMGLREFASLLSFCRIFISGDCGPMHLATSLGVPTLSLFLVENSYRYAPQGPQHRVAYRKGGPSVDDLLAEFDSLVRELEG